MTAPPDVQPKCRCGRKLRPCKGGDHATFIATRTCQGCGTRWRVTVHPARKLPNIPGARAHKVDLVELLTDG